MSNDPSDRPPILDNYPGGHVDEAVHTDGELRQAYQIVMSVLDGLGPDELARRVGRADADRAESGVVFTATIDDRSVERAFPLDLVPRIIDRTIWARLSEGAEQRARALNAFLADVHGDLVSDPGDDHVPAIVAAGIVPAHLVTGAPGYRPAAIGVMGPADNRSTGPGGDHPPAAAAAAAAAAARPRATVYGLDLLSDGAGRFVVLEDNLQVPSGLAYALANRHSLLAAVPELAAAAAGAHDPAEAAALLHRALRRCAPAGVDPDRARVAVLSDGPGNSAWYEHRMLAELMGVPVVGKHQLARGPDGGVVAVLDPPSGDSAGTEGPAGSYPIDVVYRRVGDDELLGDDPADLLLTTAARAGRVAICNAAGNGVADDKAIYAFVGPMIRFYLGQEPLLDDVGTWVLADPGQYDAVRGRMGELVVKPVDGSGGDGVMIGPELTGGQVADVEAAVAADPARYIAQDVIRFSTHPTLTTDSPADATEGPGLQPRRIDLRMFVVSDPDGATTLPAALSRVAAGPGGLLVNSSAGGGSKDTWIMR